MTHPADPETALIEATVYRSHAMTARLVTARKPHRCAYSRDTSWARGCRDPRPGDLYVRVTMFPGHDFLDLRTPQSGACCLTCAAGYSGLDTLAASVMPPEAAAS